MTGYACCQHCERRDDGTCIDLHPGRPAHSGLCPFKGCTVGRAQGPREAAQEARGGQDDARTTTGEYGTRMTWLEWLAAWETEGTS